MLKFLATGLAVILTSAGAMAQTCTPKVAPPNLVSAGKLMMSINPTLPPQQFIDEKGQLQGLNAELGAEIARLLCLQPDFVRMDFPAMIPALQSGKFDAIDTGMFWTEERSKLMYLVPHALQAISIMVLDSSTLKATSLEDLSGKVVALEVGTYTERKTREFNAAMVAKGMKPIELRTFNVATESFGALRAGQVEAALNIDETAVAMAKRGGIKVLVSGIGGAPITFAFKSKVLAEAVAGALNETRASGFYDKVFEKFGMTRFDEPTFSIKGPGPGGS